MRYMTDWPRLLLTLPYPLRLGGTILCALLGLLAYIVTFPLTHNGTLLTISVGICAWMFGKRGLFLYLVIGVFVLITYHTIRLGSWLWPYVFALSFSGGFLFLVIEGLIVITLRNLLDTADNARQHAQEAERRIAIAYEQQYRLNQIKDQFLLNMNHELRTPLTELHGYLELLHERIDLLDPSTRARFVDHALHASTDLQLLVNNVLDALHMKEQSKTFPVEELAVASLIDSIIKSFDAAMCERYTILLHIPEDLIIVANAQAVRQVMRNLLLNAFKYVPQQTSIIISAAPDKTSEQDAECKNVCISVQDEGPGIPAEEIPLLFGQFVRLKRDVSGSIRGTGLGLYISKQLVEAMGGRIWVESDGIPGHGSRFCFVLPHASQRVTT